MADLSNLQALAACLANIEIVDESGEPNTFSLDELKKLGSEMLDEIDRLENPVPKGWDVSQPMRLNLVVRKDTDNKQDIREEAYKVSEFLQNMLRERDGAEFGNPLVTEFSIEPDGYVSVEPIEDDDV